MSLIKRQRTENHSDVAHSHGVLYQSALALEGHAGPVLAARFNPSGDLIATAGTDKQILFWNLPTKELYNDNDIHNGSGKLSVDHLAGVVNANYGVIEGAHRSAVTSVRWTLDSSALVTSSADTTVGFWDVETGRRTRKCAAHSLCVNEVDVSSTTGWAVSCGDDGVVNVWDPREKYPVRSVRTQYPLTTCIFDSSDSRVLCAGIDATVRSYDMRSFDQPVFAVLISEETAATSLARNSDDSVVAVRTMDGNVTAINGREFVPLGVPRHQNKLFEGAVSGKDQQLQRVALTPSGTGLCTGSEDSTVISWDYMSRRVTGRYTGHSGTVIDVDYHTSGDIMLSSSSDGTVIVRELVR